MKVFYFIIAIVLSILFAPYYSYAANSTVIETYLGPGWVCVDNCTALESQAQASIERSHEYNNTSDYYYYNLMYTPPVTTYYSNPEKPQAYWTEKMYRDVYENNEPMYIYPDPLYTTPSYRTYRDYDTRTSYDWGWVWPSVFLGEVGWIWPTYSPGICTYSTHACDAW